MLKLLVVESNSTMQDVLKQTFSKDSEIEIVGFVKKFDETLSAVQRLQPHVVAIDVHFLKSDAVEITRRIMQTHPTPIVLLSESIEQTEDVRSSIQAGALILLERPSSKSLEHARLKEVSRELIQSIKLMSEIKVIRRWGKPEKTTQTISNTSKLGISHKSAIKMIVIGASTGGPTALVAILSQLPLHLPVPILIAQHMTSGFIKGFVDWLGDNCELPVHLATNGEALLPGHVYIAPDHFHLGVDSQEKIELTPYQGQGPCPSVAHLFTRAAQVLKDRAIGVLLTGMGKDGADELKIMKEMGSITIAQDKESSIVHGMPGEAIKNRAATYVLPLKSIARMLLHHTFVKDQKEAS